MNVTTLAIVLVGWLLPHYATGVRACGFTPLPLLYFLFLGLAIAIYLLLVEYRQTMVDAAAILCVTPGESVM